MLRIWDRGSSGQEITQGKSVFYKQFQRLAPHGLAKNASHELKGKVKVVLRFFTSKSIKVKRQKKKWTGECRHMTSLALNTQSPKQKQYFQKYKAFFFYIRRTILQIKVCRMCIYIFSKRTFERSSGFLPLQVTESSSSANMRGKFMAATGCCFHGSL